jgi:hypothetical protein
MPFCPSRLSANLFCSLAAQPILASRSLRQFRPFRPFSLYKKLLLAYAGFWVTLSIDPVASASVPAFFAFW